MDGLQREELEHGRSLRLWLSDQQWMNLLEQVERSGREYAERFEGDERRDDERSRHSYRVRCAVRVQSSEGASATYVIMCRNISAGGLGFLTAQPLEVGQKCTLALQGDEGQGMIAAGRVVWCRPIEEVVGEDAFEVGVQFDQPIDVNQFADGNSDPTAL